MRVLVVDDDTELLELVQRALTRDGHEVWLSTSAQQAQETMLRVEPELVVVDLGLPDVPGEELCRRIRRAGESTAILVLTAKSAVASRVQCLDDGADDYLTKPFAIAELRARVRAKVRALSRRVSSKVRPSAWSSRGVMLDFAARRATVAGVLAPITAREWGILEALASHPGQVVDRRLILSRVWNQVEDEATGASLEVLIGRIRRKLGSAVVRPRRSRCLRGRCGDRRYSWVLLGALRGSASSLDHPVFEAARSRDRRGTIA